MSLNDFPYKHILIVCRLEYSGFKPNPVENISDGLLFDTAPRYCISVYGDIENDIVRAQFYGKTSVKVKHKFDISVGFYRSTWKILLSRLKLVIGACPGTIKTKGRELIMLYNNFFILKIKC